MSDQTAELVFERVGDPFKKIKPIKWLIEGHIERGTMAMVFGPPAGGKSFIATSMACAVATGTPWYGFPVAKTGVLYIAGEGLQGLLRRFSAWSVVAGVNLTDAPLYRSTKAVPIGEENALDVATKQVESILDQGHRFPGLIVIDTLARNFGSGDENSTKDMSQFINEIDEFFCKTFKSTVLIVHHSGHVGGRARGSSALNGAMDHVFSVTKNLNTITMVNTKAKESEPADDLMFSIRQVDLGIYHPTEEDMIECQELGYAPPEPERVSSACLDVTYDPMEVICCVNLDGYTCYSGDVVRHIDKGWQSMEHFQDCLNLSKKNAMNALHVCSKHNLIYKDPASKKYFLTEYGRTQVALEGKHFEPKGYRREEEEND